MAAELRKWRTQQSRYFADPDAAPPPEVRTALAEAASARRTRLTCFFCFGEGHESSSCPQSAVPCTSCGGRGHKADGCPIYFMELSIRGSLTTYVQQRKEQMESALAKAADKGRFPALDTSSSQDSRANRGNKNNSRPSAGDNMESLNFSAIQCIICGKMGHANCGPPPVSHRVVYCPRCAQVGHAAAGCTRVSSTGAFNRPSLLEQVIAADPWKHASRMSWDSCRRGKDNTQPLGHQLHKPKARWQKHRKTSVAKAAAADPWHPSHLR